MYRQPQGTGKNATHNTRLAAACATLGITVTTSRKVHEGTDEEQRTFCLADSSEQSSLQLNTASLLWQYKHGELEKADPNHPLLDAMRGLHNRGQLVKWIKEKRPQLLALHPDRRCPRTTYQEGEPIAPAAGLQLDGKAPVFETTDIAIASALSVVGIPVLQLRGHGQHVVFIMAAIGFPLHTARPQDARQIVADFESGKLPAEHPFRWAHSAVLNYRVLLDTLANDMLMVFYEDDKGSGRAALIRADAKTIAYDKANEFFRKPILP